MVSIRFREPRLNQHTAGITAPQTADFVPDLETSHLASNCRNNASILMPNGNLLCRWFLRCMSPE